MNIRKFGAAVAVAVLVLATACSSDTDSKTTNAEGSDTNESAASDNSGSGNGEHAGASIQFINPLPNTPVWRLIGDCMAEAAESSGLEYTETGSSGQAVEAAEMTQQIQQAISTNRDIIITYPASEGFSTLLKQAQDKGIITGTMYGSGGPDSGADFNAGFNWEQLGALYADTVSERGGPQVVGLVAVAPTGQGKEWVDGFTAQAEQTDNVTIGGIVYTDDDSSKALDQVSALLTAHPDITVVASHMGTATQGAVTAIEDANADHEIVYIANGPSLGGTEALESGIGYRVLLQDVCSESKTTVETAIGWLNEDPDAAETITVDTVMASKDDIQSYLDKGWA